MNELSIKEKAKAYDEAIERVKKIYGNGIIEEIFPELKEEDAKRIRKNCIHFLELQKQHHAATFEIEECIDWLEKQGLYNEIQKFHSILSNSSNTGKNEQKSADKIEPKFKIEPKSKFDPKTLQPFDRVLTRDNKSGNWSVQLFSHTVEGKLNYPYLCINNYYKYCIPYNDDTKHLVGTTDEAPEFYRYWED